MSDCISIHIGPCSNFTFTQLSELPSNKSSQDCHNKFASKSLFLDTKKQFLTKNPDKLYSFDSISDKKEEIPLIFNENWENSDERWADNIAFTENHQIIKIPDPLLTNQGTSSNIFGSLNFIESSEFLISIEESMRKMAEPLNNFHGFQIFADTFNNLSFAEPIILDYIDDEFHNKYKIVFGIFDSNPEYKDMYAQQLMAHSLVTIETLLHPNTLFIPISSNKFTDKTVSNEMVFFDNWSKFGFSFTQKGFSSRARIFAYLIDTLNFFVNDSDLSMWDIVDTMASTVWGSQGSMAGISFLPYDPIPPESHVFRSLNNYDSIATDPGVLCYSPGFTTTQPSPKDISYQLVSLNHHPRLNTHLFSTEISDYKWRKQISREFNHDTFTSETMMRSYLEFSYPDTVCEVSSYPYCISNQLSHCSNIFYPSISSLYTGKAQFEPLSSYMNFMRRCSKFSSTYPTMARFDLSEDGIENYLNQYSLKCATLDSNSLLD